MFDGPTSPKINESHTGDEGPQNFADTITLMPGAEYNMTSGVGVFATTRVDPAQADGVCHGDLRFTFASP